jgi:hypothetical protein
VISEPAANMYFKWRDRHLNLLSAIDDVTGDSPGCVRPKRAYAK